MANAAYRKEDVLVYELKDDEVVFPLVLDQGGAEVAAFFRMDAQIPPQEYKRFLNDMAGRYKSSDTSDERTFDAGDDAECRRFVERHFRGIEGVEGNPTREEMRAWLDENPGIKVRIFSEGYDRVLLDDEDAPAKLKLVIGGGDSSVKTKRLLYVEDEGPVVMKFVHTHRRVTEEDRIRHKRTVRLAEKGRFQQVRFDWDGIERLYDSLINGVEGFTVDGVPCTEANRAQWITLIPLPDKVFVVSRIFSRVAVKNG